MAQEPGHRRALVITFTTVFVDLLGFGILIPIIPLYAQQFGASEFVVGVLIASYSITQFIFAPILGRLSDQYGRRPVLLISLLGSVIAWTLFGLANGLIVLFAARLLAGAMGGNIATAQAYIADITRPDERAKGLGLVGAAFGLGFVFGPALGGIASSPKIVMTAGRLLPAFIPTTVFTLPSFLAAGICALNLIVAVVILPETRTQQTNAVDDTGRLTRLLDALSDPRLNGLIIAFFLLSLAFSGMESMFVLLTKDLYGYGPTVNGYVLAYVGVVIAVVQGGLIGRLTERFTDRSLAIAGISTQLVTLAAIPFAPELGQLLHALSSSPVPMVSGSLLALLAILSFLAAGNGIANVTLTTLVSRNADEDQQGGAFGLTQSAGSVARAVGPVAAGALYASVAYWSPIYRPTPSTRFTSRCRANTPRSHYRKTTTPLV
ncbi:MFS transporter [Haladaptatus caseinilyticus]|uniref:MFS transporter n=1 Tax=Haladaptatus caseinilyticus TaxID=2993314 RepID=UPI00224B7C5D|nr:MFS transporter [Haladaptatus caseinilyticus]